MKLAEVIVITASYYGKTISEPLLKMYIEDLSELSEDEAIESYRLYRKNPKNRFFPLPAQILEIARPEVSEQSLAVDAASKIVEAIAKFGSWQSQNAKAFLGEQAWGAVQRSGGWQYLCENMGVSIQPQAFTAQARELIKSHFEIQRSKPDLKIVQLESKPGVSEPVVIENETDGGFDLRQLTRKEIISNFLNQQKIKQTPEGSNV